MLKTADLNRSKKLKSLGWEQESDFYWRKHNLGDGEFSHTVADNNMKSFTYEPVCSAPQAGEMIEWLLGEDCYIEIWQNGVQISNSPRDQNEMFETKDGLCNALADACAWVKEQEIK